MKKLFVFLTILFASSLFAFSQEIEVSGLVIDKKTKEPLPFANIIFTKTTIGTTTDVNGMFYLKTNDESNISISVSYMGYETTEEKIKPGKNKDIVIEMKPSDLFLSEVEFKAKRKAPKDTAAMRLFRNVVKNKDQNRPKSYDFFSFQEYNKMKFGVIDVAEDFFDKPIIRKFDFIQENIDTVNGVTILPVLIKESVKAVFFRKDPEKTKKILVAEKFSGIRNGGISDFVDYNFENIDVYNNVINVNQKAFTSPFANNAQVYYRYFLSDTVIVDGFTCYKLEFTGKSNVDQIFSGYALIVDSSYAIKSIRLEVLPSANLNFVTGFVIEQEFDFVDSLNWFMQREFMQTEINLIKSKKKVDQQSYLIQKTSERANITVNVPIPEELMSGDEYEILEGARTRTDGIWDSIRFTPLNDKEANVYLSVEEMKKQPIFKFLSWATNFATTGFIQAGPYIEIGRWYQFYSKNAVEGNRLKFGLRTRPEMSKIVNLSGYFAYGMKDKLWKYEGNAIFNLPSKNERWHQINGFHRYDMVKLDQADPLITFDNLGTSLFRKKLIDDIHLMRWTNVNYEKEWLKGLNTVFNFTHKISYSVPTGITFLVPTGDGTPSTDTIRSFTTTELSGKIFYGKDRVFFGQGPFLRYPTNTDKPMYTFSYTAGIKNFLKSDFGYHKLFFSIDQRWLNPIGYTKYLLYIGKVFGEAPYTALEIHKGNNSFMFNKFTYNAMSEFEYVGDFYAGLWIEHNFDGLMFNKIPLIKKLKLREIFILKTLWSNLSKKNESVIELPLGLKDLNGFYVETGFGISNIMKLLRVDFLWRVTQRKDPDVNHWAIKVGIVPGF